MSCNLTRRRSGGVPVEIHAQSALLIIDNPLLLQSVQKVANVLANLHWIASAVRRRKRGHDLLNRSLSVAKFQNFLPGPLNPNHAFGKKHHSFLALGAPSTTGGEARLENCLRIVEAAQERLSGRMKIDCVVPDYYARYPKACMGGWGRRLVLIDPSGQVLPCHAAGVIPGMSFDNVREHSLEWIWRESAAFQRFRGEQWMPEPCRSCDRRAEDFGGCRCQAFLLTGDASATDPVCTLAPTHHLVEDARPATNSGDGQVSWSYRANPE